MIKNDIFLSIKNNNTQPIRELMWGTAGTMLASHFMHQWTSEPKWKDIYITSKTAIGRLEKNSEYWIFMVSTIIWTV